MPLATDILREHFLIHKIGRIYGGRGFRTGKNMFRIGRNTFYDWKNKIPMKILEFKRSGIGLIAEFRMDFPTKMSAVALVPAGTRNQQIGRNNN
jgi:hypothetical protein